MGCGVWAGVVWGEVRSAEERYLRALAWQMSLLTYV